MSYSRINQNAENIAASVVHATGKEEPTLENVLQWFQDQFDFKFDIKAIDLSNQELSGMVHANGPRGSFKILVNDTEPLERQRFSLVHELGHIIQEQGLLYGCFDGDIHNNKEQERFCNRFAAAILMPAESFKKRWRSAPDNYWIRQFVLSEHYGVSKGAIANRAKDLDLL